MLSTPDRAAVSEAFFRLQAAADQARSSTTGVLATLRGWWGGIIGAGTAVSGAEESARHTIEAVPRLEARLEELLASETATHADAVAFVRDVEPFADVTGILAVEGQLSAGAVVDQVVKPAARELVDPLVSIGKGTLSIAALAPWILLALGVFFVWRLASTAGGGIGDAARTAANAAADRWKAKP